MSFNALTLIGLLVTISAVFAAVSREEANPDRPAGYCLSAYYEDVPLMREGEVLKYKSPCRQIICNVDGTIDYYSCGSVAVGDNCELVSDPNVAYPECCPKPKCPKD